MVTEVSYLDVLFILQLTYTADRAGHPKSIYYSSKALLIIKVLYRWSLVRSAMERIVNTMILVLWIYLMLVTQCHFCLEMLPFAKNRKILQHNLIAYICFRLHALPPPNSQGLFRFGKLHEQLRKNVVIRYIMIWYWPSRTKHNV